MQVHLQGHGVYLGMQVQWQLCMRQDGAFWEMVKGQHMEHTWGHDGSPTINAWEVCSHLLAAAAACDTGCVLVKLRLQQHLQRQLLSCAKAR